MTQINAAGLAAGPLLRELPGGGGGAAARPPGHRTRDARPCTATAASSAPPAASTTVHEQQVPADSTRARIQLPLHGQIYSTLFLCLSIIRSPSSSRSMIDC
jgi:hypothetical protein